MLQNNPRFPLYIVSKGRADSRLTSKALESMGVPYRIVVEPQEVSAYSAVIDPKKVLALDMNYKKTYETRDPPGDAQGLGTGAGAARNFIWDHAISLGAEWHWVMDDNIYSWFRLSRNEKIRCGDGTPFLVMEDFCLRYRNIAMAGPNYEMFIPRKQKVPPFVVNTRIYSCSFIRNDVPFRWRCRYNEDTDLSLRMLKKGWATVQFNAFLQKKVQTQVLKGGNTTEIYQGGTLRKSMTMVEQHPDVSKVVWKFGRVHHHVDYRPFKNNPLIPIEGLKVKKGIDDYGMKIRKIGKTPVKPSR